MRVGKGAKFFDHTYVLTVLVRGRHNDPSRKMETLRLTQLIKFLQEELAVPKPSISLALKQSNNSASVLPIILWQYGLITLAQLDRIFDWLETV
jgi:Protein of unknown function (DUF2949)